MPLGCGMEIPHRDKTHRGIQRVEGLRGSGTGVGFGLPHAEKDLGVSIPGVGVLPFLRSGRLRDVQNPVGIGNFVTHLP